MRTLEDNLYILDEVIADFETLILSKDLFWPLMGRSPSGKRLPKISLGGIQLLLDQLCAQQTAMNTEQTAQYQDLLKLWQLNTNKWVAAAAKKATREIKMRLSLWSAYLSDLGVDRDEASSLSQEVHHRVMLSRLADFLPHASLSGEVKTQLHALEIRHSILNIAGDFIWDDELEAVYSRDEFPFLYSKPRNVDLT